MSSRPEMEAKREHWQSRGVNRAWAFRGAMAMAARIPPPVMRGLTDAVADFYLSRHPELVPILADNLAGLLPHQSRAWLEARARATVFSYAQGQVDYLRALSHPKPLECARLEWPFGGGDDPLLHRREGVVLVLCHAGMWEMGAFLLDGWGKRALVTAAPEADRNLDEMRLHWRGKVGLETLPVGSGMGGLFRIQSALEEGAVVIALVERALGRDRVPVRFGARNAHFLKSPFLWAWRAGVAVVPAAFPREGNRYRSFLGPLVLPRRDEDGNAFALRAAQECALWFADIIRDHPEQWYNFFPYWEEE